MCRRVFRGLLVIPGCKTVCYRCILLPCYSQNESDDEKDDKDDEGYDSCGNAPSDTHLADGADIPLRNIPTDTSHDYVNQTEYTNLPQTDPSCNSRSCENLYVTMQLDSTDHLNTSRHGFPIRHFDDFHVRKLAQGTAGNSDYVNTDRFAHCSSVEHTCEKLGSTNCSRKANIAPEQEGADVENKMYTSEAQDVENHDLQFVSNNSPNISSDFADAVRLVVSPLPNYKKTSSNKQRLVLLETDL